MTLKFLRALVGSLRPGLAEKLTMDRVASLTRQGYSPLMVATVFNIESDWDDLQK